MFTRATAKLTIGSLDNPKLSVETDYNPKELALSRTVPWANDKHFGKDALDPEYTGSQPRTMDLELLFDAYEKNYSLQGIVTNLERMATPDDLTATDETKRRPHYCVVTWGQGERATTPAFRCVIESVAIKVTMFAKDGAPLRIVANVKVREARMRNDSRYDAAEAAQLATAAKSAAVRASDDVRADAEWRRRQLANELE
jgi:hypothetical protein